MKAIVLQILSTYKLLIIVLYLRFCTHTPTLRQLHVQSLCIQFLFSMAMYCLQKNVNLYQIYKFEIYNILELSKYS